MTSLNEDLLVEAISWSNDSYYLAAFINQFSLPQVVRVERGHDGGTENSTLGYGEVLTLHTLREKRSVVAEDKTENAILLSLDFPQHLEILPQVKDCSLTSCGITELRSFYQSVKYVEVIQAHYGKGNNIDSAELGEVFEILDISKPHKPEKTKVHVKNVENNRKLTLTATCTARFRPLLDWKKYKAPELKTHAYGFPVRVRFLDDGKDLGEDIERFISQNPDINITGEVDNTIVIATTVGSNLVKSCLEIPKDLEIKLKVAEGEQDADIVKSLDERFDVMKFMDKHLPALIKRRDVIKKYNYEAMKEFMIDKSTINQQEDEGEQDEDAPDLPPRLTRQSAPPRPHKAQGLSPEVKSKINPDVPLPPKPYTTHRMSTIDIPTESPKVPQSTTNTAPLITTEIPVLPSHVFQTATDSPVLNPNVAHRTTDASSQGEKQNHAEDRPKVKRPKPLPPVRQDKVEQKPSNIEAKKSNETSQPARKDDNRSPNKTFTPSYASKDLLTETTTMNPHMQAETTTVTNIKQPNEAFAKLPCKREKSFSATPSQIQQVSHGEGIAYNDSQRSTDDPPKLPPKSPGRIRKISERQTSVCSDGRNQVPSTPPLTRPHAIQRGPTRQTLPKNFIIGKRATPNEYSEPRFLKDEPNDGESIYEEPFHPDKPNKVMPVLPQPKTQSLEDPYRLVAQIPQDLSGLSVSDVSQLLKNLKMQEYVEKFKHDQIDGSLLKELKKDDLKDLKMQNFHQTKLLKFIDGWRPNQQ